MKDVTMPGRPTAVEEIFVTLNGAALIGSLTVPPSAHGVVLFAHGSGSSRLSPRNSAVAGVLNDGGLATLLFDLLTHQEAEERGNVFDVPLLAERLRLATEQLSDHRDLGGLPIGYFGASTGAAAALWTASLAGPRVGAVVSRGGRPDLAGPQLAEVSAPTLLIVGERDPAVINFNVQAQHRLRCPSRLEIVPTATHLFEEPGTLEVVAELARQWFDDHLGEAALKS